MKELESIAQLGFDYFELTMDSPNAHYTRVLKQKDRLLGALDALRMGLVCHLPTFVSTADLTESIREASVKEVKESLTVAAALSPEKVVLHPSVIGGLGPLVMEQARKYAFESLKSIVKHSEDLGLVLCIENMFPRTRSLVAPQDFVEVFERFPDLRLTLDTGHAHMDDPEGRRALDFIEKFPDRIWHVHVSDNFGKEDQHLPIGTGSIDFMAIVKALRSIGYSQTVTLEIFSRDRDYLKISKEKFADMVRKLSEG
jgi:sugar phosphate isomerase/epimerase